MLYTKKNILVSMALQCAEVLKEAGYSVFWNESKELDETEESEPLGVVTLVEAFPANPQYIQRLNDVTDSDEIIVIPAFSLQVSSSRKIRRTGLGESTWERERQVRFDGFARDQDEQEVLANLLLGWLDSEEMFTILNYDEDVEDPEALELTWMETVEMETKQLDGDVDAIRNYIKLEAALRYIE